MSVLGDNLKKSRLKMDITQAEIAAIIHKAPETYCRYEAGTLKPDIDTLIELANLFHVSLDWLTGRTTTAETYLTYFLPGYSAGTAFGDAINRKRATKRHKKAKQEQANKEQDAQ